MRDPLDKQGGVAENQLTNTGQPEGCPELF